MWKLPEAGHVCREWAASGKAADWCPIYAVTNCVFKVEHRTLPISTLSCKENGNAFPLNLYFHHFLHLMHEECLEFAQNICLGKENTKITFSLEHRLGIRLLGRFTPH